MTTDVEMGTEFHAMHKRLTRAQQTGGQLEIQDLDYWGDRFVRLHIRFWTGITFERYLNSVPWSWEVRARARAERFAANPLPWRMLVLGGALHQLAITVGLN